MDIQQKEVMELVASEFEHEADTQNLMEAEAVTPDIYADSLRRMAVHIRAGLLPS